jgi:hypothetical protein
MQFTGPTYHRPAVVPEREFPSGTIVQNELRVWAISMWRGPRSLAHFFLSASYHHLSPGSPWMFTLERHFDHDMNMEIGLDLRPLHQPR